MLEACVRGRGTPAPHKAKGMALGDEPGGPRYEPRPTRRVCIAPSFLFPALFVASWLAVGATAAVAQERECGDRAALVVVVLDESGTVVLPGATVVLRWTDAERMPLREAVDADGRIVVCVPRDATRAVLWAEFGDASSGQAALVGLEPADHREIRLRILNSVRSGRLVGRVFDRMTGDPVTAAAVSVRGRPLEVESDRQGRFRLAGVPVGEHEIEVRHIGYARLRHAVSVTSGITTEAEIGLVPEPVELEPLVATGTRSRRLEIKGFYERRHWGELLGLGTFITAADIDRWRSSRIDDVVTNQVGGISPGLLNRRTGCVMQAYLDGIRVAASELRHIVLPIEVAGIEVYRGPASLPAEFGGSSSRCGVVVIWTK